MLFTAMLPDPQNSRFGRQDYWNEFYQQEQTFSWYATWDEMEPFVKDFVPDTSSSVLLPGVGNDATLVKMFEAGYVNLTAMDYAPEAIARCREMLEASHETTTGMGWLDCVSLVVANARNLNGVFEAEQFDAVFEKGTLDAIFLSGGQDKVLAYQYMNQSITELSRCVKPGGVFLSVAAVVTDFIQESFQGRQNEWKCLVHKDEIYMSNEGFTSNNIDGTLTVWEKIAAS
ncbi:methyltransferase domain containing protein [Nitzschia inconspicua]|uniref:Methyltransferase domain containing protein n=1 Tax=Nitzschia inconspicua TaxID=303405 RepID=A0A9K3PKX0_9STRA|nr:methyltransferase domain containing protein [Nitzschia inconspicua]